MKKIALILGTVIGLLGLSTFFAFSAVASPAVQVCNQGTPGNGPVLCMNVAGGIHALNRAITGYSAGDRNGTFQYVPLIFACHDGIVHTAPPYGPCPFVNPSLDAMYDGAAIIALQDYNVAYGDPYFCAGMSTNNSTLTEQPCPDAEGLGGGGHGVLWVAKNISDPIDQSHVLTPILNVFETNHYDVGSIMCAYTKSSAIFIAFDSAKSTFPCKWHQQ
jgi:hypothetical protein